MEPDNTKNAPPNIVLIVADDLGYGDLACYGSDRNDTPHIDSLAQSGMTFTDFYVSAPVCSPSRASLMTGCYAQRVGLSAGSRATVLRPADPLGLHPSEITIAEVLKQQGYATGLVGKWHVGDQVPFLPSRHGFDYYFGLPYSNDMGPDHWQEDFPPIPLLDGEELVEEGPHQSTLTHRYTDACVRFIENNRDRPFFLYFAHMYVHVPIHVPPEFAHVSRNGDYGAAVACIDWSTGRIMNTLERFGLLENTIVILTSDNGSNCRDGGSNDPLRGKKGTTWEGGLREPCIMAWPGHIPAGSTCREVATTMDLLPTFARIAGTEPPRDRIIDGGNILPLLTNEPSAASPYEYFYYYRGQALEAVRDRKWKLHLGSNELYDLSADIGESTNLFEERQDVVRRLHEAAEHARKDLGDTGVEGANCRPAGYVENPLFLHDRDRAEYAAEYD